jgi:hypothetical protein
MTIAQARLLLLDAARNANADQNNSTNLDYAIQAAGNEFVSRTRCVIKSGEILLASPDDDIVSGDWASDFRADRLLRAWVRNESEDLQVVAYREVVRLLDEDSGTGIPTLIGFASTTTNAAKLWRYPSAAINIDYQYFPPFTAYTAGTGTDGTELNIPEDMIRPVINCGAVYYLLKNMPENADWVDRCRRDFEQHIQNHMSRASTGARSAPRAMLE